MAEYQFQVMAGRQGKDLHHSEFDDLTAALKKRMAYRSLELNDQISEENLRRRPGGYAAGADVPGFVTVTIGVEDALSREEVRTQLQQALVDLGRSDLEVVNA